MGSSSLTFFRSDMRIVSLLPSATEIVYALGVEANLVGVTHECNWPPAAASVRHVSHSNIPTGATSAQIDELVMKAAAGGEPTTWLDEHAIRQLQPDLILTQDLCAVCAVPAGAVDAAMTRLGCSAQVLSLDPSSLDDMLAGICLVGAATRRPAAADQLVSELRGRLNAVRDAVCDRPRPRVLALEWADPPFNAGHWVPEMIELAGGIPVLARAFSPSVIATDGDAFFSRPGPRLVDGVEILAGLLHPDCWPAPPEAAAQILRQPVLAGEPTSLS
jgi:iron complex transport system substrate-binding protein